MISDITSESLIHRFGYAAAMAAATKPTRSDVRPPGPVHRCARRRPASPIIATVAIPSRVIANRCRNTLSPSPKLHGVR